MWCCAATMWCASASSPISTIAGSTADSTLSLCFRRASRSLLRSANPSPARFALAMAAASLLTRVGTARLASISAASESCERPPDVHS